jgi:hypothetical protein
MSQNKKVSNVVRFTVLTAMVTMMMASSAFAQQKVCINLVVGAAYAAWMEVKVGDLKPLNSDSFPVGQKKCVTIKDAASANVSIKPGTKIVTTIHSYLGKSKVCTPSPISYDPNRAEDLIYNAWGTTMNVSCSQ